MIPTTRPMLTLATLGMTGYGLYSLGTGLWDLFWLSRLEPMANLASILLGAMLILAGLFIRVGLPGSLALALGALFGLQSLSLHNAGHLYDQIAPEPQVARAVFSAVLIALAFFGRSVDEDSAPSGQDDR